MKCRLIGSVLAVFLLNKVVADKCNRCIPIEECSLFNKMSKEDQKGMLLKFPCTKSEDIKPVYGFSQVAKGDYICCPAENVWGIENSEKASNLNENKKKPLTHEQLQQNTQSNSGNSENNDYEQSRYPSRRPSRPNIGGNNRIGSGQGRVKPRPNQPIRSQSQYPEYPPDNGFNNSPNYNNPINNYPNANNYPNNWNNNFNNPNVNNNVNNPNNNNFNNLNNNNNFNNPNNNFNNPINNNQGWNTESPRNNLGGNNVGRQCSAVSSLPPSPDSGCCGLDTSLDQRANSPQNPFFPRPSQNWNQPNPNFNGWGSRNQRRFIRAANNGTVNVTIDNRIAGGKATDLEQFPWTVLLQTTFDYGNRQGTFNCGGSLISSKYILTAAHCVAEEGARVASIDIYLAEYDKRSFPRDCITRGGERKCIENIVLNAEDVTPHQDYDERMLQNDIALIRLRGNAPYTAFIRPICLPPINIDNPEYSDIRLAVAGWGRNGRYTSQVKQSTVVNLVPQRECSRSYPNLTPKHLCAAGHSGEDTCKGDSGGPLMMLFEGKYFVSGVVSGKRADSPCGTSVPSLYTNVYHYIDWIRRTMRN